MPLLPRGLICDDDPASRRAVATMMRRFGYSVVGEVRSPSEALAAAEALQPDLVVLELAVTGVRGLQVVRLLREAAPMSAVVVLSSFAGLRVPALEAGACDLVANEDLRGLERCLSGLAGKHSALPSIPGPPEEQPAGVVVPASYPSGSLSTNEPSS